jgi:hypothetical protein
VVRRHLADTAFFRDHVVSVYLDALTFRYTADVADNIRKAASYGFGDEATASKLVDNFDWTTLKHKRDDYIKRLNGI